MKKLIIPFLVTILFLTGCWNGEPEEVTKTQGEIIGKELSNIRTKRGYYLVVSYQADDETFLIDKFYVEDSEELTDEHYINQKVDLYINKSGIEQILRNNRARN